MDVELGIIEGFYGRPWSWDERAATIAFLAPHGYGFYLYAPKVDTYLRRRWQEDHPREMADELARLAGRCAKLGVRFGIGISPFEVRDFGTAERDALGRKLAFFDAIGVQDLAILFDDMRGDVPGLADRQIQIVDWAAQHTSANRIIVCPSYYTDDPVLDRVFGQRPPGYLERLGAALDPRMEIFWTGEEVCSREYSPGHLRRVADQIRRKPFLWDNYPVNDGQRMSQFLHVRGVTGRPAAMADLVAAHGVNPALQPTLTRIPALTLVESYRRGEAYEYGQATLRAAVAVMGEELAERLYEDVLVLQDIGLDRLDDREAALRERWTGVDHPAAREIIAWLDGEYRITDEIVQTQ
ncbi:beta-N-acetylglucosaminidase domain-containing protein [Longimicrobium sp.]|uniref:beta-N-acetylglucosaminidase domain-containing protein n=1 Tax=Longimicrobium sp. TaxID=2029185 RepID=UPI003B3AE929